MDDVVSCLLLYIVVILYMTSSAPERFRRSWFWVVTDSPPDYRSIGPKGQSCPAMLDRLCDMCYVVVVGVK